MSAPADAGPCHSPGSEQATVRPWADDPQADDKDALFTTAVKNAYGVPVVWAAREAFDAEVPNGGADHRLAAPFATEARMVRATPGLRDAARGEST